MSTITERISAGLVDETGSHPDVDTVRPVVEEVAAQVAEAPIQDFVPLITEHRARDVLHDAGLRVDDRAWEPVDETTGELSRARTDPLSPPLPRRASGDAQNSSSGVGS
jgi:hypothetical protein